MLGFLVIGILVVMIYIEILVKKRRNWNDDFIGKLQVATDTGNLDVVFSTAANSDCRLVLQRNYGFKRWW